MGLGDRVFGRWIEAADDHALVRRDETLSSIQDAIAAAIADRAATFGMADAMALPPVIRAVSLLTSTAASFLPLAYRDGYALPIQPRIVTKPSPFGTRYEFVAQTVGELIQEGCAYWWHPQADRDPETGKPRQAIVIPHEEVEVTWQDPARPLVRRYRWRGRPLGSDEITHLTIGRRPGELHGTGPLRAGLDALAPIAAAEEFARDWFASGGLPSVVIKALGSVPPTTEEAAKVKAAWIASRSTSSEPAAIGKDWDLIFPQVSPESGQMQESRAYGSAVVARLLGIPAALLHVETSGATITYTNPSGALEDLVKSTLAPQYLAPMEAAWSGLVPNTQAVRFDLADLQRVDFAARIATYAQAIGTVDPKTGEPLMSVAEARSFEGWSVTGTDTAHQFDPSPSEAPTYA